MALQRVSDTTTAPNADERRRVPAEKLTTGLVTKLTAIKGLTPEGVLTEPFTFQVAPLNTFPINRSYPQTTYDTIGGEQRSRPGIVQLRSVSYQTLFTEEPWSWTHLHGDGYLPNPLAMLAELEKIAGDRSSPYFQLTVRNFDRAFYEVNWPAALTDLNSEEHEGEPDARYFTVTFLEYKDSRLQQQRLGGGPRGSGGGWTVQADMLPANRATLYGVALFYYGDPTLWPRIAKASGLQVPPSFNLRLLGHVKITIPGL